MANKMGNNHDDSGRRPSTDSRRSSFQFLRKNAEQQPNESRRNSRRFSFLPNNFSMNSFSGAKREDSAAENSGRRESRTDRPTSKGMAFGRGASRSPTRSTASSSVPHYYDAEAQKAINRRSGVPQDKALPFVPQQSQRTPPPPASRTQYRDDGYNGALQQEPVERYYTPNQDLGPPSAASDVQPHFPPVSRSPYPTSSHQSQQQQNSQQSMRPNQRKFDDAYEKGHDGSSSGARRVMDFFRRRGRERGGEWEIVGHIRRGIDWFHVDLARFFLSTFCLVGWLYVCFPFFLHLGRRAGRKGIVMSGTGPAVFLFLFLCDGKKVWGFSSFFFFFFLLIVSLYLLSWGSLEVLFFFFSLFSLLEHTNCCFFFLKRN
jgi:hypothetical protein